MNPSMPPFGDFSNGSDTLQFDASSSSSPAGSNTITDTAAHSLPSDEEVILASARPKKRAGRKIFQETRHPVYRGVRLRNKDKWVCEMRVPNNKKSRIWLGTYTTPEMAARAHDVAALTFRGKSACLNFADSAWRVKLPKSTDPMEIRRAAIEAAEMLSGEPQQQQNHYQNEVGVEHEGLVMEDANANETMQEQNMYDEHVAPAVSSGFDEMHDFRMSFSDVPIMSRPPSPTDFTTGHCWHDVEIFDTPVSLWNF